MEDQKENAAPEAAADGSKAQDSVESVEIAGITELAGEPQKEPTASAAEQGEGSIDDEIAFRLRAIDALMIAARRTSKLLEEAQKSTAADGLVKIIRPLCVQIENLLPKLRDFADDLEALGEVEKSDEIRRKLNEVEDEHLQKLLAYLQLHPVTHPPVGRK